MRTNGFPDPATWLLTAGENALGRVLAHDPDTQAALAELAGRVFAIEITEPSWRFYVLPRADGLGLIVTQPERIDVTISGRPAALLGMLARRQSSQGHVELRGDIHLAQRLQTILRELDVDWDDFLSRYVGDVAAHRIGRIGRRVSGVLLQGGRRLTEQLDDYIRYEQQLLPPRAEVDEFMQSVDELRDDVERLQQRLQRLQRRRHGG